MMWQAFRSLDERVVRWFVYMFESSYTNKRVDCGARATYGEDDLYFSRRAV